jgi:hypothetical protein
VRAGAMVSGCPGEKPRRREGGLPHGWFIPRAVRAGKSGGLGRGGVPRGWIRSVTQAVGRTVRTPPCDRPSYVFYPGAGSRAG